MPRRLIGSEAGHQRRRRRYAEQRLRVDRREGDRRRRDASAARCRGPRQVRQHRSRGRTRETRAGTRSNLDDRLSPLDREELFAGDTSIAFEPAFDAFVRSTTTVVGGSRVCFGSDDRSNTRRHSATSMGSRGSAGILPPPERVRRAAATAASHGPGGAAVVDPGSWVRRPGGNVSVVGVLRRAAPVDEKWHRLKKRATRFRFRFFGSVRGSDGFIECPHSGVRVKVPNEARCAPGTTHQAEHRAGEWVMRGPWTRNPPVSGRDRAGEAHGGAFVEPLR